MSLAKKIHFYQKWIDKATVQVVRTSGKITRMSYMSTDKQRKNNFSLNISSNDKPQGLEQNQDISNVSISKENN